MTNNTSSTIKKIFENIKNVKVRSAWMRGVKTYAEELAESLFEAIEYAPEALDNEKMLRKALLNGASDWSEYSWGGCSLIYDNQVAHRLCTASELKKTANASKRPNAREDWLDVQARALYQAERMVLEAYRNA